MSSAGKASRVTLGISRSGTPSFEIVQRRGSYRGYGAINAPFRIAAQKRGLPPMAVPRDSALPD